MNSTINTSLGKIEERKLLWAEVPHRGFGERLTTRSTGTHTVADLLCASCKGSLGWMYIKAPNGDQRYKEGRCASCKESERATNLISIRAIHSRGREDYQREQLVTSLPCQALSLRRTCSTVWSRGSLSGDWGSQTFLFVLWGVLRAFRF